jgi:hypothetical protein
MVPRHGRAHQAVSGIGDQRHAGVGYQGHALAGGERAQDPRFGQVLRGVAVGDGGRGYSIVAGELGEHARVLADDHVGRAQDVKRAQGDVTQIADRRGDNMQPGRQRRRFTPRLPTASL